MTIGRKLQSKSKKSYKNLSWLSQPALILFFYSHLFVYFNKNKLTIELSVKIKWFLFIEFKILKKKKKRDYSKKKN